MDKTKLLNEVNELIEGKDCELKVEEFGEHGFNIILNGYDKNSISQIYNEIVVDVTDLLEELIDQDDNKFVDYYNILNRDELEPHIIFDIQTNADISLKEEVV